jgi:hypothetical protein
MRETERGKGKTVRSDEFGVRNEINREMGETEKGMVGADATD